MIIMSLCSWDFSPVRSSWPTGMSGIRISRWHAVFGHRRATVFCSKTLRDRCTIFVRDAGRRPILESRMPTLRFGAIMPADLNHALEVDVHAIGELEGLEVGETNDGRARPEVLDLLEPAERNEASYFFPLSENTHLYVPAVYFLYM